MVMKIDNYNGIVRSEVKHYKGIIKVRLNPKEHAIIKECQEILEQPKLSTALKELMIIGSNVVRDKNIKLIVKMLKENKRKNKHTGIIDFEV